MLDNSRRHGVLFNVFMHIFRFWVDFKRRVGDLARFFPPKSSIGCMMAGIQCKRGLKCLITAGDMEYSSLFSCIFSDSGLILRGEWESRRFDTLKSSIGCMMSGIQCKKGPEMLDNSRRNGVLFNLFMHIFRFWVDF